MSDYRRIVSYIYRYENGIKGSNEGYVRLEIRNGQLKVTVHITSQAVRDALLKAYFYVRRGDSIRGIQLGDMNLLAGNGDFKENTDAVSIMGTGATLEDTGGMIFAYVPSLFFATEWDDRPVTKEDMIGVTGGDEAAVPEVSEQSDRFEPSERIEQPDISWESDGSGQSEHMEQSMPTEASEIQQSEDIISFRQETGAEAPLTESVHAASQELNEPAELQETPAAPGDQPATAQEIEMGEPESEWDEDYYEEPPIQSGEAEAAAASQAVQQVEYYVYGQYGRLEPADEAVPAQSIPDRTVRMPENSAASENISHRCAAPEERRAERVLREEVPERPDRANLQPDCTAVPPDHANMQPDHTFLQPRPEIQPGSVPQSWNNPSMSQAPSGQQPDGQVWQEPRSPEPQFMQPEKKLMPVQPDPTAGAAAAQRETAAQREARGAGQSEREALLCSLDEKPLARTLLDNFPKIAPFQDNEIAECVRIVPQNIGLLPIDAWVLGNNSFLQHGFYNHKHLIFAKKYTRSGIMYLLGVPGYFTQRERNMARMFGFNNFKSVKLRPVQNGEFGYWYVPIVF